MQEVVFEINDKGFCINPHTDVLFQNTICYVCIAYAQKNGQWAFGYRLRLDPDHPGEIKPVSFKPESQIFPTVSEVREAVINHLIALLNEKYSDFDICSTLVSHLTEAV